jgi:hypothetical protein
MEPFVSFDIYLLSNDSKLLDLFSYLLTQTDGSVAATSLRTAFALAIPDNSSIVPARKALGGQVSTHAGFFPSRIRSRQ